MSNLTGLENNLPRIKLYHFSKRDYCLITLLVILGVGVALLEGLGIAVFFPLLQGTGAAGAMNLPYPFNKILDFFLRFPIAERIRLVAVLLTLITGLRVLFLYFNIKLSLMVRALVLTQCKMRAVQQLMKVGMRYFNKRKISELHVIFENHIELALGTVVELLGNIVPAIITTFFLVLMLFIFSWKITLVSIVLSGCASFVFNFLANIVRRAGSQFIVVKEGFYKILFDIIQGMKIVHLFSAEKNMQMAFQQALDQYNEKYIKMGVVSTIIGPVYEITGVAILAFILLAASFFIPRQNNESFLSILLTFLIILARIVPRLKQLNHARGAILARLPALNELENFLSSKDKEYLPNGQIVFKGLTKRIEFQNVYFRYDQEQGDVLQDMTFAICKGSKVGIIGASGSGKSTIIELLLRFYDPQKGRILVDGYTLSELELSSWRKNIGVVAQDTFLFFDTVRNNIAFGKKDATDEEIERAAHNAHAFEFIMKMPKGFDTIIGDRGVLLSGGQRQRLAIARAILLKPEILIFDEATSALDSESERAVQEAIDEVTCDRTVITIAHRLSTITNSDLVIVVDQGRVVEMGSPDKLIQENGLFKKYIQNQSLHIV